MLRVVPPRHRHVVLLVQADADSREMYAEYMRYHGLRVITASNAGEALTAAHRAHAVVTGILLPGEMDGIELMSRLREDRRTAAVPLIALSAYTFGAHRELAAQAGCDLFLTKPCLPDELTGEVLRLLAARPGPRRQRLHRRRPDARRAGRTPRG